MSGVTYFNGAGRFDRYLDIPDKNRTFIGPIPTYAKRFAAKEACSKALGTGISGGVYFRDMGVVNLPSGQPTLELTNGALKRLQAMTPKGMVARIHLTITDEAPLAQAQVIIEAI